MAEASAGARRGGARRAHVATVASTPSLSELVELEGRLRSDFVCVCVWGNVGRGVVACGVMFVEP